MKIKEINFFAENPSRLRSWSNIPFLFTQALEEKGIKVNRVSTFFNRNWRRCLWNPFILPIFNRLFKGHCYTFEMLPMYRYFIQRRIRKAVKKHPHADLNLYCSYDYIDFHSNIPNVLFSDWTIEYIIRHRLKRQPFRMEKPLMAINRHNIERADTVFGLFPDIADTMSYIYNKPFHTIEGNVINNAYTGHFNETDIISRKKDSKILLFIGKKHYLQGALLLAEAFSAFKQTHPTAELHFIGLKRKDLQNKLSPGIFCHGYLDKSRPKEHKLYYDLLLNAKCLINPTSLWAGYSSMVEAMYFYTPIITTPYASFSHTFGQSINFGLYLSGEADVNALIESLENLTDLHPDAYASLCRNVHDAVKNFTWRHYTDRFIQQLEKLLPDNAPFTDDAPSTAALSC